MYLILHKVRGEPAFDIADQLEGSGTESDPGPWWIIPTSGHRAYPYWHKPLEDLMWDLDAVDLSFDGFHWKDVTDVPLVPEAWPDHYKCDSGSKPEPSFNIMSIISPMMTKIKRRL